MRSRFGTIGLVLLIGVLLTAAAFLTQGRQARMRAERGPNSAMPEGHLLLSRWLSAMGYVVDLGESGSLSLDSVDLVLLFPSLITMEEVEAQKLARWVEDGGTLAILGATDPTLRALFDYGFESIPAELSEQTLVQAQPLMPDAPGEWGAIGALPSLDGDRVAAAVPVLAESGGRTTLLLQPRGAGTIWIASLRHPFTNRHLVNHPEEAHLFVPILQEVPDGGRILIDASRLSGLTNQNIAVPETLQEWLYRTPAGWALLTLATLILFYLLMDGRRLGPALAAPGQERRREAAEFVIALADLQRRSGRVDGVARYHRRRIKRLLGKRMRISSELDDERFVAELAAGDPNWKGERLTKLKGILTGLRSLPDEQKLVEYLSAADGLLPTTVDGSPMPTESRVTNE